MLNLSKINILQRLAGRGGPFGQAASRCLTDDSKSDDLLKDCFEQCQHTKAWDQWGKELAMDIVSYRVCYLKQSYLEMLRQQRVLNQKLNH